MSNKVSQETASGAGIPPDRKRASSPAREMSKAEVLRRSRDLDAVKRNAVVCALVGHSRIQSQCFGYYYCGRCGAQVGDSLASVYPEAAKAVVIGHDCEVCRANAKTLTWRDTLYAPDPFAKDAR